MSTATDFNFNDLARNSSSSSDEKPGLSPLRETHLKIIEEAQQPCSMNLYDMNKKFRKKNPGMLPVFNPTRLQNDNEISMQKQSIF